MRPDTCAQMHVLLHAKNISGLVFILWFALAGSQSFAQRASLPVTNEDSLRSDYRVLKTELQNNFPALYRFVDSASIERMFDSGYNAINAQTTWFDFFRITKSVLSTIKDGHLASSLSDEMEQHLMGEAGLFPLRLYFSDTGIFVLRSVNNMIDPGAQVFAINGVAIDSVRCRLYNLIVSDGFNESKKRHVLNRWFGYYYFICFGSKGRFEVQYRQMGGGSETKVLRSVKMEEIQPKDEDGKLLELSFIDNVALLRIATFDRERLQKSGFNFPQFMDSCFSLLSSKNTGKLIIDLRNNGGGRDLYGSLLYSYLSQVPFRYYRSLSTITTELPFESLTIDQSSYNNLDSSMLLEDSNGRYVLSRQAHDNIGWLTPNRKNFSGKVWVLINGTSFSTTTEFCAIAKSNDRVVFVGEETGGGYEGNTGIRKTVVLPYSKIKIHIPLIQYNLAVKNPDERGRGIVPHYRVFEKVEDILNNKDVAIEQALKLAKE